ncbi:rhombosortase [Saccharophagus degradans]|uniref:rhombosortase n=1 Tax=Saccharophagus degradans TaxID=86304 RepID=UPI002478100C|nr:rhombosortase [Saccharophagus degradans]WGO97089.1 rhombosortase [Saccharophagus degradans]
MDNKRPAVFTTMLGQSTPWFTIACCALLVVCYFYPPIFDLFYFERNLVNDGEVWRLLTSQFVHLDNQHLLYNCGAMLVLGLIIEEEHRIDAIIMLTIGLVVVGACLPFSQLDRYAGLSGAINALVPPAIWLVWARSKSIIPIAIALLYFGRLAWEFTQDTSLLSADLTWPSYTPAHLQGLAAGLGWMLIRAKPVLLAYRSQTTQEANNEAS